MKKKWKASDKANFFLNLSRLLERGYTLHHGASLLGIQDGPYAKSIISNWLTALGEGKSWEEALERLELPNDIQAYLFFSERYGRLNRGFYYAGRMLKEREKVKQQFMTIARYPILLIWIIAMLFSFMVFFVFPQFEALFQTMDIEYPAITTMTFLFFQSIPYGLLLLLVITILGVMYYYVSFKNKTSLEQYQLLLKIPLVKRLLRMYLTYSFSLQFGQLLKGGLHVLDVLTVFVDQSRLSIFKEEGERMKAALNEGLQFPEVVVNSGCYTAEFKEIIQHGQQTGKLADDLIHYSEMLWNDLLQRVQQITMTVQPILFLVIGLFMLLLFLSIFLPIFQLITSIDAY
ncbi:hypothetical protein DH09_07480 [Bacillaceae bacterium JMAK1]|nr:hypothetical protein DH09_07480 [Bacillaceae bacterium JMAK1]